MPDRPSLPDPQPPAVDDDAVDDAAAYWREHAAEKFKGLVDAEEKASEGE